jgi:steroid delta-isomerase-like uncharacterized protein
VLRKNIMLEENKALVRSFFDKTNSEERTAVELCTPDFIAYIGGNPAMDLQAFQQYQKAYFSGFSDTTMIIEDMIAEGDRVAFRGVVRTTHSAEFRGIPASGKQIEVPVIGMAQIVEGKIANWWNSPDRLSWMQQIGAIPS